MNRQAELKDRGAEQTPAEDDDSEHRFAFFEDDILTIEVEEMLSDAGFTPAQTQQLLEMSLLIVKGMAANRFLV